MEKRSRNKIKIGKNSQVENASTRIFNNGMRLFLERGYHGTSIDDITQAAFLTKGAFYWHFRSKEDLLIRIMEEFEKNFLDDLIQSVNKTPGTVIDKIDKYFRYNAAFAYHNRELSVSFHTLSAELVGAYHSIEKPIRQIYQKYQKFLSELISQGKKEKVFKKEIDPDLGALIIIAFHAGILLQWSMNRERIDGKTYSETYKRIILNGLMA